MSDCHCEKSGSTEALRNRYAQQYIVTPRESRASSEVVMMEVRASAKAIEDIVRRLNLNKK